LGSDFARIFGESEQDCNGTAPPPIPSTLPAPFPGPPVESISVAGNGQVPQGNEKEPKTLEQLPGPAAGDSVLFHLGRSECAGRVLESSAFLRLAPRLRWVCARLPVDGAVSQTAISNLEKTHRVDRRFERLGASLIGSRIN